jgi:hypothetical protein
MLTLLPRWPGEHSCGDWLLRLGLDELLLTLLSLLPDAERDGDWLDGLDELRPPWFWLERFFMTCCSL